MGVANPIWAPTYYFSKFSPKNFMEIKSNLDREGEAYLALRPLGSANDQSHKLSPGVSNAKNMFSDSFDAFSVQRTPHQREKINRGELVKFDKVVVNVKNNYKPHSGTESTPT